MLKNKMESTYTLTEKEYVNANKLFTKPNKNMLILYFFSFLVLVMAAVIKDTLQIQIIIAFIIIGGFVGHVFVRFVYAPVQTKHQYREYKAAQESSTIVVVETGIIFKSQMGESIIEWSRINNWRENNQFILIYQSRETYHIIPKRIGEVSSVIQKLLLEHIGNAT